MTLSMVLGMKKKKRLCDGDVNRGAIHTLRRLLMATMGGILICLFLVSPLIASADDPCESTEDGIPEDIRSYCEWVGEQFGICPELLEAMAWNESRFIPDVKSGNYYGLMQINVKIHEERIEKYGWTKDDMFNPLKNLIVAADYLLELYETYGDDDPVILMYYSGNSTALKKYYESGYLCSYVRRILERSANYERLHGK